jgi:type II secretory pathway pseudopilin PulG
MWARRLPEQRDRGETLLELIIAVSIMGVAFVAILGGIGTSILMSDIHRKQATAGAYVRDYAEAIQNTVAAGGYVPCATTATYAAPAGFAVPSGFAASVLSVQQWSGAAWQASCTSDSGLQQLKLQVASADSRAAEQVVLVLRKPCRLTDAPCS